MLLNVVSILPNEYMFGLLMLSKVSQDAFIFTPQTQHIARRRNNKAEKHKSFPIKQNLPIIT